MSENYLKNILVNDPDNLSQQLTLKGYIDLYTEQGYSIMECVDYLLEKEQIKQIDTKLIDALCKIYKCNRNQLETYYAKHLQYKIITSESENESEYVESDYTKSDSNSTITVDTMDDSSQSENVSKNNTLTDQQLNEREKLKNDVKQILDRKYESTINNICLQIDKLFNDVLEKEISYKFKHNYKYVITNNIQTIKDILNEIEFICRLNGKQVEEDKILEIKQLIFKAIVNKCVEMYNTKNRKLLNITKVKKIKHFKDLVKLSNDLGMFFDKNRKFGSELKDFCKASYLNEKLEMNGDNIRVKINNNTYEILKDNTNIEIQKSNKKDIFKKISETINTSKLRVKVNDIDILSRVTEAIDEINNIRQINSSYQSLNEF